MRASVQGEIYAALFLLCACVLVCLWMGVCVCVFAKVRTLSCYDTHNSVVCVYSYVVSMHEHIDMHQMWHTHPCVCINT